jgi:hypothetical protein
MAKDKRWLLIAIYFGIAIYLLPVFPHGGSANELTRWATAASIVEKGSFDIQWTEPLIGPNVDTARVGPNLYSNKAPGTAIIAVPFYAIARVFVGPPNASNIRVTWFVMRIAISTLPLLLLAIWLYRRGADEFGLAALLFATPLLIYSLLFFSHVFVAVAVYFAFRLLFDESDGSRWHFTLAGALSGIAVISEFPAVFPVVVLAIGIFFMDKRERVRRLAFFVIGGLPFAIFLLIYNDWLFGSPFSFSYSYETFPEWAEVANAGAFGIGFPTISNLFLLLLSPSRGLFFFAPLLVLGVVNFFASEQRATVRHRVKVAAVLLTVLVMSGHAAAHGGWAVGPRYLVLIVPLLLDSFFDREPRAYSNLLLGVLFGVSLILCTIPILTFPFAPPEFASPHNDFWVPVLFQERWFVPNMANVIGAPSSAWTLIPIVIALVVVVYIVCERTSEPRRFLLGLAGAAVFFGVYATLPLSSAEDALRRATIAERFFRPADRLTVFEQRAAAQKDYATLRRITDSRWTISDARAYAPDDFPYLAVGPLDPSPSMILRQALHMQTRDDVSGAEKLLTDAKRAFPFANCEFATSLAVIYYTSNRKDQALQELESIQAMVNPASRPQCARSQYLLGSLYKEMSRPDDAANVFREFLSDTDGSNDPEIVGFRNSVKSAK